MPRKTGSGPAPELTRYDVVMIVFQVIGALLVVVGLLRFVAG